MTHAHKEANRDPANRMEAEEEEPESVDAKMTWIDWLPREIAHKVRRFERVVDEIAMGAALVKKVKGMKRKHKLIAGAIVVAGVAGAAYLQMQRKKK